MIAIGRAASSGSTKVPLQDEQVKCAFIPNALPAETFDQEDPCAYQTDDRQHTKHADLNSGGQRNGVEQDANVAVRVSGVGEGCVSEPKGY